MNNKLDYKWAFNKIKLEQAQKDLVEAKKLNPNVVIDEASIKARYELRGGLVLNQEELESMTPVVIERKPVIKRNIKNPRK